MLEKWYVWDGDTDRSMEFRKYVKAIMYGDSLVCKGEDLCMIINGERFFWGIGISKRTTIVAYTLGEKVASKKRIKCGICNGTGRRISESSSCMYDCNACDKKGYTIG
ncbi:MAG: hypothetical protein KTR16_16650 [Acidiferrobacterales bacterium]|nr:hypothetical protein [Acidiferrobacterales bacterium]